MRLKPPRHVALLGAQREELTCCAVLKELAGAGGRVALVTAGWQEEEGDDAALAEAIGLPATNLKLYERAARALGRDPEFADALHQLQRQLKEVRRLYNVRLAAAMEAVAALLAEPDSELVHTQRDFAFQTLRDIDRGHLDYVAVLRHDFAEHWRFWERPALASERAEIEAQLADTEVIVVAGGHVAVLLNRLRLFRFSELTAERQVVAWSAGAMVLSPRIVLFHDSPPWGPGHPEVFEAGLGVIPRVVALPRGRRRLRLDDAVRVARFARRFEPARCVVLGPGARLDWDGRRWWSEAGVPVLSDSGRTDEVQEWQTQPAA